MVAQTRLLSILFLLVLTLSVGFTSPPETITNDATTYGEISANVNKFFDTLLPSIRHLILKRGLDPLQLQDISKNLPGIIVQKRTIKLTDGWLQGLSNLRRTKDIVLSYENKVITVDATLGFDAIDVTYRYLFKDFLVTRRGDMHGSVKSMELRIVASLNMEHYRVSVPTVKVVSFGKLDLKLKGNMLDPILNAAIKAVTPLFREQMARTVEERCLKEIQSLAMQINEKIPQPDGPKSNDAFVYVPIRLYPLFYRPT